ncbi:MAG: tetratricopeptide repeat protein [Bacteroidetes bacterium]|nr:tetratricopeptide repeat protein [Bacteroidota bacterium]
MKKISIIFSILFTAIQSFSQSQNLDSLKHALVGLSDTARIDCLNAITEYYMAASKKDSAIFYQDIARRESEKINYIHGIAEAISIHAEMVRRFEDNFPLEQELALESLKWFAKTDNKKNIEIAYMRLSFSLFAQSCYGQAIPYQEKAIEYFKKNGKQKELADGILTLAMMYNQKGDYDKGFMLSQNGLKIAESIHYSNGIGIAMRVIARIYVQIEDYPGALDYFKLSQQKVQTENPNGLNEFNVWPQMQLAEIYWHLNEYDSALQVYNLFDTSRADEKDLRIFLLSKGEFYLQIKKYDLALQNLKQALVLNEKKNDRNQVMRNIVALGRAYLGQKNGEQSLQYGLLGLNMAMRTNSKQIILNSYDVIQASYNQLHKIDSAYAYYNKFIVMKDSVLNDKIKGKITAYTYEQRIAHLNDENKLREQQLRSNVRQTTFIVVVAVILIALCIAIMRNTILKRRAADHQRQIAENELQQQQMESKMAYAELQSQKAELEMKVLRAQMNPHFIFNSLNSINRFILQNDSTKAAEYLAIFSRLIRMILQNSQSLLISLESELDTLDLYLEIESLRFDYHFEYQINVSPELEKSMIKVPPLIIQPFVENAIWHGLMPKQEKGSVIINVTQEDSFLVYTINDNGIGRKKASSFKSKSSTRFKPLGVKITSERITILKNSEANKHPIIINDLVDPDGTPAGTEVIIKIPLIYADSDNY